MSLPSVWFICTSLEGFFFFNFIFTEAALQLTQNLILACQLFLKLQMCVRLVSNPYEKQSPH